MTTFNGKYDSQVWNFIQSFETLNKNTNVTSLNSEMQNHFKVVESYCESMVSLSDVLLFLRQIEDAIAQGRINETINSIKCHLHKKRTYSKEDALLSVKKIGGYALEGLMILSGKTNYELKQLAYNLYIRKNECYNDGWHKLGLYRIFLDLYRKMYRLNTLISESKESMIANETLFDTLIDTFNYCSFMLVGLTEIDSN
jgi:hypothetical protein